MSIPTIQVEELKRRLDAGENLFLLDVREEYEFDISNIGGHLIPLPELSDRMRELDASQEIIALCKMGTRSAKAVQLLNNAGFSNVRSVTGGIHAWSDRVDPFPSEVPGSCRSQASFDCRYRPLNIGFRRLPIQNAHPHRAAPTPTRPHKEGLPAVNDSPNDGIREMVMLLFVGPLPRVEEANQPLINSGAPKYL
jgi:rhodanese-related sulfurtransferase